MGRAGKRKEMVKDWCGASCVWKKFFMDKLYCMDGWMGIYL
jgi:hypothetical protein